MSSGRKAYHHGNLPEALVAAAIELIEEKGAEALSVRDVARRLGVSPAAPFRHFRSREALLTAVAEQAMARLQSSIEAAVAGSDPDQPVKVLKAIGIAYLHWAASNPTHFQIISSRTLIDFDGTPSLVESNARLREILVGIVARAKALGEIAETMDGDVLVLSLRAFAYGLARMRCDGHIPEWHGAEPPDQATVSALDQYIELLRSRPAG